MEQKKRQVSLQCPTCGGTDFEHDDADTSSAAIVTCVQCNRETTREQLIADNSSNIEHQIEEMKKEVLDEVTKNFRDSMKKNKFIKIK